MKNFKARLAGILACLLLFIVPLQADAGWNASPLPAASINTVFGDSTYLNPEWMTKKVTITWNGNTWMTGMDAFKNMPVRLTNNNGAIDCTFLNTAVFQSFFSAINASIASMTTTAAVPVFDNGTGSYIRISGTQHTEAVSSMPDWLAQCSGLLCPQLKAASGKLLVPDKDVDGQVLVGGIGIQDNRCRVVVAEFEILGACSDCGVKALGKIAYRHAVRIALYDGKTGIFYRIVNGRGDLADTAAKTGCMGTIYIDTGFFVAVCTGSGQNRVADRNCLTGQDNQII